MALLTPATISELLDRHDLRPSRALGQHFLADPNTARRIVRLGQVDAGDHVLEIGPGVGSLTVALAEVGASVTALELDRHLLSALEEVVGSLPDVRVVQGDALAADLGALLPERPGGWKLVANLPYNLATPMVARVLEEAPTVSSLLVMVQREVGERLAASAGGREYGAISVKVAYYGNAKVVGAVPRTVFLPPPNVDSALVRVDRHASPPVVVPSPEALFALVRTGFAQRRKMLRRALQPQLGARTIDVLEHAGVDPRSRAESLDLEAWAAVARAAA
ncbi:MAG: 16S rRNA (adenine(1518)-N(6)/adenine(1519)-N(6))-dimethyltransferase RsmA [Acidimicrobiia bacterium]